MQENYIRTKSQSNCPACKSRGSFLYHGLTDKLFNTQGVWDMKKCNNSNCRTLWLDPTPIEEDIPKLYVNYITHNDATTSLQINKPNQILNHIRNSYIYTKYGYDPAPSTLIDKILWLIAYLHPAWRDTQEYRLFYLPAKKDGLLLDVGCGDGNNIMTMEQKGWRGVGIDFDEQAIKNAKKKGLNVHPGDLFSQKFDSESFDAIIMNHVIEHIPHPVELLQECHRILKKNGVMVVTTPNANSFGHMYFGRYWIGLHTPHHLQIFTPNSLSKIANIAGFENIKKFTSTQGQLYILNTSRELLKYGKCNLNVKSNTVNKITKQILWFILGWLHILIPRKTEVAVIVCKK